DRQGRARTVDQVSALARNLIKNLNDDIALIEGSVREGVVSRENVPPEIGKKVLPRLKDAAAEIAEYVRKNINQRRSERTQKRQLSADKHQRAIESILRNNGIDRVVSTVGGDPGVGISERLQGQGFKETGGPAASNP